MYTATELKDLPIKPRINDISLKILADYYSIYLIPFVYKYTIKGDNNKEIKLLFGKENFCHLLGLESIAKYSVPFCELHKYRGVDGWENIYGNNDDGFILNIQHLKNINKRRFNNVKAKFVYFYLLPNLISDPLSVNFENSNVACSTKIDCEIIFYSKVDNDNAIIHLGIKKDHTYGFHFPKTFFVEKVSCKDDDIYLSNQEEIETVVSHKIIML